MQAQTCSTIARQRSRANSSQRFIIESQAAVGECSDRCSLGKEAAAAKSLCLPCMMSAGASHAENQATDAEQAAKASQVEEASMNSRRKRCRKKSKKPKRAAQARLKRDNLLKNPQLGGSRIKSAQGAGV